MRFRRGNAQTGRNRRSSRRLRLGRDKGSRRLRGVLFEHRPASTANKAVAVGNLVVTGEVLQPPLTILISL